MTSALEAAETAQAPGTRVFLDNRGRFRWYLFAAIGIGIAALMASFTFELMMAAIADVTLKNVDGSLRYDKKTFARVL